MKKILFYILFILLTAGVYGQVTNKDIEVRKASPTLKLNGTGANINFYNGDVTITQSSDKITVAGGNITAPNFLPGYTSTPTAAGTTTLTVASNQIQIFTGSTTQTVKMPVVTTLALGHQFFITNNSTEAVTVNSSGNNAIVVMAASTTAKLTCVAVTGTGAASWTVDYSGALPAGFTVAGSAVPVTLTATELGYLDGVTSAIQTQLTARQYQDYDYFIEEVAGTVYARPSPNSSLTAYNGAILSGVLNSAMGQLTTGGKIYIAEGDYADNDSIVVPYDNITIEGAGMNKTIIRVMDDWDASKHVSGTKGFFQVLGKDYFTIRNLQLDGNGDNQTYIDNNNSGDGMVGRTHGLWIGISAGDTSKYPIIDRCYIANWAGAAGLIMNCNHGLVTDSKFINDFSNGITAYCYGNMIENSYFYGIGDVGAALYGYDNVIRDCDLEDMNGTKGTTGSGCGISIETTTGKNAGVSVINNKIHGHCMKGIGAYLGCENTVISGNEIYGFSLSGGSGITSTTGVGTLIQNNYIYGFTTNALSGIILNRDSASVVSNNVIDNPEVSSSGNSYGILTYGTKNCSITNNFVRIDSVHSAIALTKYGSATYSTGNVVKDNYAEGRFAMYIPVGNDNNTVINNRFKSVTTGSYDFYDLSSGTVSSNNQLITSGTWTPFPTLSVGDRASSTIASIDSITKVSSKLVFYESGAQIDPLIKDTINLSSVVPLLNDTIPLFVFGLGGGLAADTAVFNDNALAGAFYNAGSDTLVVTQLMGILAEGSGTETVSVQVNWHTTFKSGSAEELNDDPLVITSITTGTADTSFKTSKIPPNVFVWCTISGITAGDRPSFLSLTISGYKIPTY